MGRSIMRQAVEKVAASLGPEWDATLATIRRRYEQDYGPLADVVHQERGRRQPLSQGQAYAFAQLWTALIEGEILTCAVDIGAEPCGDIELDSNRASLSCLPTPFSAECWNGLADTDGFLAWHQPIFVATVTGATHTERRQISASCASLEIGDCPVERLYLRLFESAACARWPYGETEMTLLWAHDWWMAPTQRIQEATASPVTGAEAVAVG